MSVHASQIDGPERRKRARVRSAESAAKRVAGAAVHITRAAVSEMLDDDTVSGRFLNAAAGHYRSAGDELDGALALIRDCSRSIERRVEDETPEEVYTDRLLEIITRMEKSIESFLNAEVTGMSRDNLPFHMLDEARLLPPDILATVRRRQEET